MKKKGFEHIVEKLVSSQLRAIDALLAELVEPIEKVGSPEVLIDKPYNQWTPEDLNKLISIYGTGQDSPLQKTIFAREYEKIKALEAEV
jgi:hypothetical protein